MPKVSDLIVIYDENNLNEQVTGMISAIDEENVSVTYIRDGFFHTITHKTSELFQLA